MIERPEARAPGAPAPPDVLEWRYDPWRERPRMAWGALLAAGLMCVLVVALRESFLLAAGLCAFTIAAFAPAISPRACRVDGGGAEVRGPLGPTRRAWREVRRVDDVPIGLLLSPHAHRSVLDAPRALLLPMPMAARERLRADVRTRWQAIRGA